MFFTHGDEFPNRPDADFTVRGVSLCLPDGQDRTNNGVVTYGEDIDTTIAAFWRQPNDPSFGREKIRHELLKIPPGKLGQIPSLAEQAIGERQSGWRCPECRERYDATRPPKLPRLRWSARCKASDCPRFIRSKPVVCTGPVLGSAPEFCKPFLIHAYRYCGRVNPRRQPKQLDDGGIV